MLRTYNNEADNLVRTMKPCKLDASLSRIAQVRETIARLGKMMSIEGTDAYHRLRIAELTLTADYLAMVAEEKERAREERERGRRGDRFWQSRASCAKAWQGLGSARVDHCHRHARPAPPHAIAVATDDDSFCIRNQDPHCPGT